MSWLVKVSTGSDNTGRERWVRLSNLQHSSPPNFSSAALQSSKITHACANAGMRERLIWEGRQATSDYDSTILSASPQPVCKKRGWSLKTSEILGPPIFLTFGCWTNIRALKTPVVFERLEKSIQTPTSSRTCPRTSWPQNATHHHCFARGICSVI